MACLIRNVDFFRQQYADSVKCLCSEMEDGEFRSVLFKISDELFKEGITWGRMIALFALVGEFMLTCLSQNGSTDHYNCLSELVDYSLEDWIEDHNGWKNLPDWMIDESDTPKSHLLSDWIRSLISWRRQFTSICAEVTNKIYLSLVSMYQQSKMALNSILEADTYMKSEHNRRVSFQNICHLSSAFKSHLVDAGFFYLQEEDKIECAFCQIKISDWITYDNLLREHIKINPMCPFLRGDNVGNIPERNDFLVEPLDSTVSYKPKHPRMSNIARRRSTFSNWPLEKPESQLLVECGLFYTGVQDVVNCYFCGVGIAHWEPSDDPWHEHARLSPDCGLLNIEKYKKIHKDQKQFKKYYKVHPNEMTVQDSVSDIIEQAQDIFPEYLVSEIVKMKNGNIFSLQELCDDILKLKLSLNKTNDESISISENDIYLNDSESNNTIENNTNICKICMNKERNAVFQPCGHLVCCLTCAGLISDCPLCRTFITSKIKIYVA